MERVQLGALRDLFSFGVDVAESRFPLTAATITLLVLVSLLLFQRIKRERLATQHENAICRWKLHHTIALTVKYMGVVRILDRRTMEIPITKDQRDPDVAMDRLEEDFQRVLAGPQTEKDWAEVDAADHEIATEMREYARRRRKAA